MIGRFATFDSFECHVSVEAWVDESGGRVDEEAEAAEQRLAVESRDEVVGQRDPLERRTEHELAGMEDERVVVGDLHQFGQRLLRLL